MSWDFDVGLSSSFKIDVTLSVVESGRKRPDYTIDSDLNGEITMEDLFKWSKRAIIEIARTTLEEEQARGFDKEPLVIVDNKLNKPIESVSPVGKIEFVARTNTMDFLLEAYEALLGRSKVKRGNYIRSHQVVWNRTVVASDLVGLNTWIKSNPVIKDRDRIMIINSQPYARRLELLGVTAQRQQNRQEDLGRRNKKKAGTMVLRPNGAYQLTYRALRRKYKHHFSVRFTFLPGDSLGLSGSFKGGKKGGIGRAYLYPALVFIMNERGATNV